jgi:dihydrofolate reductase
MRKVITGAFVSLDGVIQAPGGPKEDPTRDFRLGGWVVPYMDEVFGQAINEMFGQPFELLLGRKTYEIFAAHWPYAESGEDDFIAKRFNSVTKYVATRSTIELTWKGSVALRDAAADVARLKREDGPALLTQGSSNLIQTLLATDLIDEISTFTFPIVLGNGKKLFGDGARPRQGDLNSISTETQSALLLQLFNLLDREITVRRPDPHVRPIGDGELVHHEINGTAQGLKMSFMAAPVWPGLPDFICRHPVHVSRQIEFHSLLGVKGRLDTSPPFSSIKKTK